MNTKQSAPFNAAMPGMRIAGRDSRAAPVTDRAQRFDEAMCLMEDGRWERAFTRLAELADAGHPQAARIAMVFVQRGACLFGGHFSASARQCECWRRSGQ